MALLILLSGLHIVQACLPAALQFKQVISQIKQVGSEVVLKIS